jgi:hypothetical protein
MVDLIESQFHRNQFDDMYNLRYKTFADVIDFNFNLPVSQSYD